MKFLFIVQTDGRGHISQAMALADILEAAHHNVVHVLIGKSHRIIPEYLLQRFHGRYTFYDSPNFAYDASGKGLDITNTVVRSITQTAKYLRSLRHIRKTLKAHSPDVVVNFYDIMGSMAQWGSKWPHTRVVISHHFFLTSSFHELLKGRFVETLLLKALNRLIAAGSDRVWALSFREETAAAPLHIMPPLIRKEILEAQPTKGDYLLTYAVNSGYAAEIKTWQAHHPEVLVHCFWDGDQESAQVEIQKNLFLHRIDQQKFTQLLVHCKAYACTAGFESVCEAMYLSKPIFLVPVSQHIEQANNAVDAAKTGYCHIGTHFNLDAFMKFINQEFDNSTFKKWILSAPQRYLDDLNR